MTGPESVASKETDTTLESSWEYALTAGFSPKRQVKDK